MCKLLILLLGTSWRLSTFTQHDWTLCWSFNLHKLFYPASLQSTFEVKWREPIYSISILPRLCSHLPCSSRYQHSLERGNGRLYSNFVVCCLRFAIFLFVFLLYLIQIPSFLSLVHLNIGNRPDIYPADHKYLLLSIQVMICLEGFEFKRD